MTVTSPMRSVAGRLLVAGLLAASAFVLPAQAEELDKAEIEKIVREYLLSNPEIIQEAMIALEQKRRDQEAVARARTIQDQGDILFNSVHQAELGNPDGDVTLVEFFDYNCGFCKRAMPDLIKLIEEDSNLRVVIKEFPVLGQGSVEAAQVSVAVNTLDPQRYLDFHASLLAHRGQINRAVALQVAEAVGFDRGEIEAQVDKGEANASIEEVYALANNLGLTGTPSYVVGNEVVMGAVGYETLREKVQAYRQCGSTVC